MKKDAEESLDNIFERNMPPGPPSPEPCVGCGGGSGEPHMWTFDQHHYDMQLVGEFTLAESEDFTIQMRTSPAGASNPVSMITAIAVESGGERFTIEAGREDFLLHDGAPSNTRPISIETGSVSLSEYGGQLEIAGPDGARALITGLGSRNFAVAVDPGSVDQWHGLIGSPDGDPENDLTSSDGDEVSLDVGLEELHETFAHTWRFSPEESLFDYDSGQSTDDFTDLNFPKEHLRITDLDPALVALGEELCAEIGITDPTHVKWCVFDFAATGDISFITAAVHAWIATTPRLWAMVQLHRRCASAPPATGSHRFPRVSSDRQR